MTARGQSRGFTDKVPHFCANTKTAKKKKMAETSETFFSPVNVAHYATCLLVINIKYMRHGFIRV